MKRKTITCKCNAYHFPHRWQGGKCSARQPWQFTEEEMMGMGADWQEGILQIKNRRLIVATGPEFEYDL